MINVQIPPGYLRFLISPWNNPLLRPFYMPETTLSPRNAKNEVVRIGLCPHGFIGLPVWRMTQVGGRQGTQARC